MKKPQGEFKERVKKIEDILWAVYSAHEEPHSSSAVIYYAMNKIEEAIREAREEARIEQGSQTMIDKDMLDLERNRVVMVSVGAWIYQQVEKDKSLVKDMPISVYHMMNIYMKDRYIDKGEL